MRKRAVTMLLFLALMLMCGGCMSADEVRQAEQREAEEAMEYLEDKYPDKDFEVVENTSGYGEGGRESSLRMRCTSDGTEFQLSYHSDSYIPMREVDEISDAINEQVSDVADAFPAIKFVGVADLEENTCWNCYYWNVNESTGLDELVETAWEAGITLIVVPATQDKWEFRESLQPFCEALPKPYGTVLEDADREVEYRLTYDTHESGMVLVKDEVEWLNEWFK